MSIIEGRSSRECAMSKYKKFTAISGKLAAVFLFLFFLFFGMGIMESPRRTGIDFYFCQALVLLFF